jgi:hypothetical protein
MAEKMVMQINLIFLNGDVNNTIFQIVMHIDTLNTKYDADVQVKQLVRSMGKKSKTRC